MTSNPCQQLYDQYVAAMHEWVSAVEALRPYLTGDPMPMTGIAGNAALQLALQVETAMERADAAHSNYVSRLREWGKCYDEHASTLQAANTAPAFGAQVKPYDASEAFDKGETPAGKHGADVREYDPERLARKGKTPPKFGASVGPYEPD